LSKGESGGEISQKGRKREGKRKKALNWGWGDGTLGWGVKLV